MPPAQKVKHLKECFFFSKQQVISTITDSHFYGQESSKMTTNICLPIFTVQYCQHLHSKEAVSAKAILFFFSIFQKIFPGNKNTSGSRNPGCWPTHIYSEHVQIYTILKISFQFLKRMSHFWILRAILFLHILYFL